MGSDASRAFLPCSSGGPSRSLRRASTTAYIPHTTIAYAHPHAEYTEISQASSPRPDPHTAHIHLQLSIQGHIILSKVHSIYLEWQTKTRTTGTVRLLAQLAGARTTWIFRVVSYYTVT